MSIENFIFTESQNIDSEKYFSVCFEIEASTSLFDAAREISIGQSIGNPNVRSKWETQNLIENHCARVEVDETSVDFLKKHKKGNLKIHFPLQNIDFDLDGISHLLCIILGGQTDIDNILRCRVSNLKLPNKNEQLFKKPKYGISGLRKFTKTEGKPLLGGIIKPKTGMSLYELEEITKELIDGGVNFIKEDEIISSPSFLPLQKRVKSISKILENSNVVYCHCVNTDPLHLKDRISMVHELGGNGVHINVWSGLGSYKSIRDLDLPLFIHYQKSGERTFSHEKNPYSVHPRVLSYLAALCGVDTIHVGMIGGYCSSSDEEIKEVVKILQDKNIVPALSCGLNSSNVNTITKTIGIDYLANSGGAIHGHPQGTKAGVQAILKAINNFNN